MHPEDIEGLGNAKRQAILPNTNNKNFVPDTNNETLEITQEVHEYKDNNKQSEIVFESEQEDEEQEVDTEEDDDPEDNGVL